MRSPLLLSRSERRAVIILALIALGSLIGLVFMGTDPHETPPQTSITDYDTDSTKSLSQGQESIIHKTFDPNTVDSATLVQIGISPRRVHTFMRYRSAGAVFAKPHDIAKCYSFSDDDIDRLLPLIRISPKYQHINSYTRKKYPIQKEYQSNDTIRSSSKYPSRESRYTSNKFTSLTKVDLNTADTALLKRIPGIGDAISSMIVNLRERLGGFTSLSQLTQIRQLAPEHMEWFSLTDTIPLRRIQINKASFKTLVSHPYISKEQANGILQYIRLYGSINDIQTLHSTALFTEEELVVLMPYLEF